MGENLLKISISSESGSSEDNDFFHSSMFPLLSSSEKLSRVTNELDKNNFLVDDYKFSKFTRWQSEIDNFNNFHGHSSNQEIPTMENYLTDDLYTKKNRAPPSTSALDVLISPLSRLSTSSSLMSFNSLANAKISQQLPSRSTITNSTDQLIVPNDNMNIFPPLSPFLPLPSTLSNRPTFPSMDNIHLTTTNDNDLQRVPPSFMFMPSSSNYANASMIHSQPKLQVVHSTGRSNTMPSWRGPLPIKLEPITMDYHQITASFSRKVFLGGIPAELSEAELLLVLRKFGKCNIKWPKNDGHNHNMPGFCHVVYREARSVCELLQHCSRQQRSTVDYFLHIQMAPLYSTTVGYPIRTTRFKPIQVVPWNMKDNVFSMQQRSVLPHEPSHKDWSRTIFVSPLHGKMTAFSLGSIIANVFGAVIMAQINTDKYGYPTGTGTVLFCDSHSYMRAVAAGAIDIKCDCFHKLLDIDPFLRENEPCTCCPTVAVAFCRNFHCLRSYCKQCWVNQHGPKPLADHQPVTRKEQTF